MAKPPFEMDSETGCRLSPDGRSDAAPGGFVFDIKKYAIHDGPGIRTTVFFKGCPLKCRWCHNPESWKMQPEPGFRPGRCAGCGRCVEICTSRAVSFVDEKPATDAEKCQLCGECVDGCVAGAREILGRRMTVDEVMTEIEKDVIFYDESGGGATFSGGEPLFQPEFLLALLDKCRSVGIHTAVDSSCYCSGEILEQVAEKADMFLCDIKHMDNQLHERFTGVGNALILDNIAKLAEKGCKIAIRIPIIPGFNDEKANIAATGDFVATLPGVDGIDILPYNGGGKEKSARLAGDVDMMTAGTPSGDVMDSIAQHLRTHGFEVRIGG